DLAWLARYRTAPGEDELMGGLKSVTAEPGFPPRAQIRELYAKLSGRDLSQLDFYIAFAYFKLGVIIQQIYYRWYKGQTHDQRFAKHGGVATNLIHHAAHIAGLS